MLTDCFDLRYRNIVIWDGFKEEHRRFLVQASKIITEQLYPYWTGAGNVNERSKEALIRIHSKLCMELGLKELHQKYYTTSSMWNGSEIKRTNEYSYDFQTEQWITVNFKPELDPDSFMKRRISFIELAFREKEQEVSNDNSSLERRIAEAKSAPRFSTGMSLPGNPEDSVIALNKGLNKSFQDNVNELNTRFNQAGIKLHYHKGVIQISEDSLKMEKIEEPFWKLLADTKWRNVDADIQEAFDKRDKNQEEAASSAAKALESTIKIISDEKGWSTGKENGAYNYIENLCSNRAGQFLLDWESESLKKYFSNIRNSLAHGAGSKQRMKLSNVQIGWSVDFAVIWIRSLILRS